MPMHNYNHDSVPRYIKQPIPDYNNPYDSKVIEVNDSYRNFPEADEINEDPGIDHYQHLNTELQSLVESYERQMGDLSINHWSDINQYSVDIYRNQLPDLPNDSREVRKKFVKISELHNDGVQNVLHERMDAAAELLTPEDSQKLSYLLDTVEPGNEITGYSVQQYLKNNFSPQALTHVRIILDSILYDAAKLSIRVSPKSSLTLEPYKALRLVSNSVVYRSIDTSLDLTRFNAALSLVGVPGRELELRRLTENCSMWNVKFLINTFVKEEAKAGQGRLSLEDVTTVAHPEMLVLTPDQSPPAITLPAQHDAAPLSTHTPEDDPLAPASPKSFLQKFGDAVARLRTIDSSSNQTNFPKPPRKEFEGPYDI